MSPIPSPSTYTSDASNLPAILALSLVKANTSPFSIINEFSNGISHSAAVWAWITCILYSPWIGMKYLGLISLNINFCSSFEPWPDVCTLLTLDVITLAPSFDNKSIFLLIDNVFPYEVY